jgi:hypothetical protein
MLETLVYLVVRAVARDNPSSADNQQERLADPARILRDHTPEVRDTGS